MGVFSCYSTRLVEIKLRHSLYLFRLNQALIWGMKNVLRINRMRYGWNTLKRSAWNLSKNIDAIIRAKKEFGVRFVPATGRGYLSIQHNLKTLGLYDAIQDITAVCDYTTKVDNNEDVIAELIEKFIFNQWIMLFSFVALLSLRNQFFATKGINRFKITKLGAKRMDCHGWHLVTSKTRVN